MIPADLKLPPRDPLPPLPRSVTNPPGSFRTRRGRGDQASALDMIVGPMRKNLSQGAARILSMTPVALDPAFAPGATFSPGRNGSPGIIYGNTSRQSTLLHEGLHAYDSSAGFRPSLSLPRYDESYTGLTMRYWGSPSSRGLRSIPPAELFASAGENGPEGIPMRLRPFLAGAFSPDAMRRANWSYFHGR